MDMKATRVEIDWSSFDPWCIQPVRHRLVQHALLRFDELIELCRRLEPQRCILHRADERLRTLGVQPPGVGKSTVLDACLLAGFGTAIGGHDRIRRLVGRLPRSNRAPYACVARH